MIIRFLLITFFAMITAGIIYHALKWAIAKIIRELDTPDIDWDKLDKRLDEINRRARRLASDCENEEKAAAERGKLAREIKNKLGKETEHDKKS